MTRKRRVQLDTTTFCSLRKKPKTDNLFIKNLQDKMNDEFGHPYVQFYYRLNNDALSMTNHDILLNTPVHVLKQLPICPKVVINLEEEEEKEKEDSENEDTRSIVIQRDGQFYCKFSNSPNREEENEYYDGTVNSEEEEENSEHHDGTRTVIIQHCSI